MKLVNRQVAALPTATQVAASRTLGVDSPAKGAATLAPRAAEPSYRGPAAWQLVTREDGAVLATASATAVTLVPPLTQSDNVKTFAVTASGYLGAPAFRIGPYTYETVTGRRVGFGNESYPANDVGSLEGLPVVAALLPQYKFVAGDVFTFTPGADALQTYYVRAVDTLVTLESGYRPFNTAGSSRNTPTPVPTLTTDPLSTTSFAAASAGASQGLSKGAIGGIAGGAAGLALLAGVGAALLVRRARASKRAQVNEAHALTAFGNKAYVEA